MSQDLSDEFLNAFVDHQLESEERSEVFDAMERDHAIKAQVCELRGLKDMVRHAYQKPPQRRVYSRNGFNERKMWHKTWCLQALVACLLLMTGCAFGWFIAANSGQGSMTNLFQAINRGDISAEPEKIIVQVSDSNPVRLKTALDETENLLESYKRDKRKLQLEIIANGGGVDLLRRDASPYASRVESIKAKYRNIDFLVCSQTLSKLRKRGITVHLLPHTGIASSAAEQISKRLLQGWDYVRV